MKIEIKTIKGSNPTTKIVYVDGKDSGYRIIKQYLYYGKYPYKVELNNQEVYRCRKLFTAKSYVYSVLNNLPVPKVITWC